MSQISSDILIRMYYFFPEFKIKYSKLVFLLLICAVTAAPASEEDEITTFSKDIYDDDIVVHSSEHDIVNILVPTNSFNFDENEEVDDLDEYHNKIVLFFVEADVNENGERADRGLFVLKDREVTKLLDHGRDAAASADSSKDVFFGAEDGIYIYDLKDNKAVKYGSVTDDIIAIAKENGTDVIYYINKDHELFKVTENGTKSDKINEVVDATEIVIDQENNLYYMTGNKEVFVYNDGVKKVEGLPENPQNVKLIQPPAVTKNCAIFLSDNTFYAINSNGTANISYFRVESDATPTAFSMEASLYQFYGFDKKIYKYNLLRRIYGPPLTELLNIINEDNPSPDILRSLAPRGGKKL